MNNTTERAAGLLFIRALLGIIFLMQGFGKVFSIGVGNLYGMFFKDFEKTFLPGWIVWFTAYYTSYIEMVCGFLLIIGLFRKYAMYLLAIDLLIVSYGHGLLEPIWDLQHVIPRALKQTTTKKKPNKWDKWSVDIAIAKRSKV